MKRISFFIICLVLSLADAYSQNPDKTVSQDDNEAKYISFPKDSLLRFNNRVNKVYDEIFDNGRFPQGYDWNFIKVDLKEMNAYLSALTDGPKSELDKEMERNVSEIERTKAKIEDLRQSMIRKRSKTKDSVEYIKSYYVRRNDSLKKQLNADEEKFKALLYEEANTGVKNWLNTPYSKINITKLSNQFQVYSAFSADKKLAKAADKLSKLIVNHNLYKDAELVLSNPYDAKKVEEILPKLEELRDATKNKEIKEEIKTYCQMLSDFGFTVELYNDFKKELTSAAKKAKTYGEIEKFIKGSDQDIIEAIKFIPWLKDEYENYLRKLQSQM